VDADLFNIGDRQDKTNVKSIAEVRQHTRQVEAEFYVTALCFQKLAEIRRFDGLLGCRYGTTCCWAVVSYVGRVELMSALRAWVALY
jgi:hypothetical protein